MANLLSTFRDYGVSIPIYDDLEILNVDSNTGAINIRSGGEEYNIVGNAAAVFGGALGSPEMSNKIGLGKLSDRPLVKKLYDQYVARKTEHADVVAQEAEAERKARVEAGLSPFQGKETISVSEYAARRQAGLANEKGETETVNAPVETQTASIAPSESQEKQVSYGTTTFLTAQRNGYTGSYTDWTKDGRPSGATPKADATPDTTTSGESTTFLEAQRNGYTGNFDQWVSEGRPSGSSNKDTTEEATVPISTTTNAATQNALAVLEASPFYQGLPEDQKALLRMTVQSWDPTKEVNMENVLSEFEKIKRDTIDPQFEEQIDVFKTDVEQAFSDLQTNRAREQEEEQMVKRENLRQTKADLEARGMTFTGEAARQLGLSSAFTEQDNVPFGAPLPEGTVNQAGRLMSTASSQRYLENLRRMGRQVEDVLGRTESSKLVGGYLPAGVTTGSLEAQKQQELANTLSGLAGQQRQLTSYKQPVDFSSFNQTFNQ